MWLHRHLNDRWNLRPIKRRCRCKRCWPTHGIPHSPSHRTHVRVSFFFSRFASSGYYSLQCHYLRDSRRLRIVCIQESHRSLWTTEVRRFFIIFLAYFTMEQYLWFLKNNKMWSVGLAIYLALGAFFPQIGHVARRRGSKWVCGHNSSGRRIHRDHGHASRKFVRREKMVEMFEGLAEIVSPVRKCILQQREVYRIVFRLRLLSFILMRWGVFLTGKRFTIPRWSWTSSRILAQTVYFSFTLVTIPLALSNFGISLTKLFSFSEGRTSIIQKKGSHIITPWLLNLVLRSLT